MIKVLIVGSKGFIGSHAYAYFRKKTNFESWGCDVVVDYVDNNYFLIDSSNSDFNSIFEGTAFDVCINCSGAASVPDSLKHPYRDFSLNTVNVVKILDAIRRYTPQCKFINMSSAAVYGNPLALPIREQDVLSPVSPYGLHKMQAEQICKSFYDYWNIGTCNLRIFSAYGPGLKKQLYWDLFQKSLLSDEVSLFGSGQETRDFIFIEDILQVIKLVIEKATFSGECFNVANGIEITIKEAVLAFYQALGWEGKVNFKGDSRLGDPLNWRADISSIQALGYEQQYKLDSGLTQYVQWLKELG